MLALKIRARAELLGLSLLKLSELADVPLRTLQHNLSTGRFAPETLSKLGSALNVGGPWFESGPEDVGAGSAELLSGARIN